MRNEFCTLFDVNYLSRAIVLYRSLAAVCDHFRLRAFCMDEQAEQLLNTLALPNLDIVPLSALESHDRELQAVKHTRSRKEYCWTATPAVCLYALETEPGLAGITYLDADLMFYSDPAPLFDELGDGSVLLVPHRFPDESWAEQDGIYNVQFLTFRRDADGLAAAGWWRERCLEWCYDRAEDGRFGDQKYLDELPVRFSNVRVSGLPEAALGPWNSGRHRLELRDGRLLADSTAVVFYHYQSLRLCRGMTTLRKLGVGAKTFRVVDGGDRLTWTLAAQWMIDVRERELHWDAYASKVAEAVRELRAHDPGLSGGVVQLSPDEIAHAAYETAKELLPKRMRTATLRILRAADQAGRKLRTSSDT